MTGTLGIIIGTLIVGLIAGLLARAIVPGKDAMGILATILLGIVGSFIGTGVAYLLKLEPGAILNWVLAIGGAVLALLIYNRIVASRATP
jgi:uncharacterized membrane protein YeaQ/YmgE (transglycosylase-associated protein family)